MTPAQVEDQLKAAGLWPFVLTSAEAEESLTGRMALSVFHALRTHEQFSEGPFGTLHPDIGTPRSDFRGDQGAFGPGSLQVVINQATGRFYADVDRFNPYGGALPAGLHLLLEVLPGWLWPWRSTHAPEPPAQS